MSDVKVYKNNEIIPILKRFKEIWLDGEEDSDDFETYFSEYKLQWFEDFLKMYDRILAPNETEKIISDYSKIIPEDKIKELAYCVAFDHANLNHFTILP